MFLKAEQYALTDDVAKPDAAKPEAVASDETKEDKIAVDIDSDPEQTKAAHPQTKFT